MKKLIFLFLAFMIYACQPSENLQSESGDSDFIDYGIHDVGFKTIWAIDFSRAAVPYSDWSGKLYPSNKTKDGRALPIHIWYPAVTTNKPPLKFEHFVHLLTRQSDQGASSELDSLARKIYKYQTNELGGNGKFSDEDMEVLLKLNTRSFLHCKASKNKFPLVIFPNGTSPAGQSIMCEYLASHGYVVACLALKGQFSHVIDASIKGLEVGVDDLEFALQQLIALDIVDGSQVGLMANAIESSFCAALASRNNKIKALISLDGGLLSQFEQDILDQSNFYDAQSMKIPILALYAPHPSIFPKFIYDLKYSERYFAHFPEMSEFHFLNYGLFEEYVPEIIGPPRGNTKKSYKEAAELSLIFLNAVLKNKGEDLERIYLNQDTAYILESVDTLFYHPGQKPPPNIAVMKDLFITKGMGAIDSIYHALRSEVNNQPFSNNFFNDFKNWLAWKKDSSFVHRKLLYEMAVESYPESSLNNYRLGYYLNETGNTEMAKKHYTRSLELLDTDKSLDMELRRDLKEAIDAYLKE